MSASYTAPCVDCGRPTYVGFPRCGECANTPPHLTAAGIRRLYAAAKGAP